MSTIEEKQLKKKKKKKTKSRTEPEVTPSIVAEIEMNQKKKKKKKKKSKEAPVVPVVEKKKKKKKKKTKKTKVEQKEAAVPVVKLAKAKKNKKRKNMDSTPPAAAPTKKAKKYTNYTEHASLSAMTSEQIEKIREDKGVTVANCDMTPIQTFAQVPIPKAHLAYLDRFGADGKPTPIQSESWAPLLAGRDCVGIAQTGSGKTLGFGLPAIPMFTRANAESKQRPIKMLTLAPTRELAQQSDVVLKELLAPIGVKTVCIYGGGDKRLQLSAVRDGAQCVTATPGRLLAYLREGLVKLGKVQFLVLDEADRMLDMGFVPDIKEICSYMTSPSRQTLLFSATWPTSIQKLATEFVTNPVHITVGRVDELTTNKNVTQIVEVVDANPRVRMPKLVGLLNKYHQSKKNRVLVFVLYKKEVTQLERFLNNKGWNAAGISSDKRQWEREQAITDFKSGTKPLLIATDVAGRGLDIKNVEYVINYSFPLTVEDYIHRIGRTGRGGAKGVAHTFFTSENKTLSGELVNVLEESNTPVPDALRAFGCFTKRKEHSMYGAFAGKRDNKPFKKKVHMKF